LIYSFEIREHATDKVTLAFDAYEWNSWAYRLKPITTKDTKLHEGDPWPLALLEFLREP